MRLTDEERKKIDEGLAVLKSQLTAHIDEMLKDKKELQGQIDNHFVNKLAETYLKPEGFAALLLDSGFAAGKKRDGCDCAGPCYVSCAAPCKNY